MGRKKSLETKLSLIAERKKIGESFFNAPLWLWQKAKKRIFTKKRRAWRETKIGKKIRKRRIARERGKIRGVTKKRKKV